MDDIRTRQDLERLLFNFYSVATKDDLIGHHFDGIDMEAHLPVFVDFWAKTLFDKPGYFGNPMVVHKQIHAKSKLDKVQFERWLNIFGTTVDKLFTGKNAEEAKARAAVIAGSLDQRLNKDTPAYTKLSREEE